MTTFSQGTTGYRAPKLLEDVPTFDNKADIWAMGCILFELATGKKAFADGFTVRSYDGSLEWLKKVPCHITCTQIAYDVLYETLGSMLNKQFSMRPSAQSLATQFD